MARAAHRRCVIHATHCRPPPREPLALGAAPRPPALLLLHGALNDASVWNALGPACAAAGHQVLAPDQPGHGGSAGPLLPDIAALAAWALRVADAAGLDRFSVAGHSMGSLIALEVAAQAPSASRTCCCWARPFRCGSAPPCWSRPWPRRRRAWT
jgi:pimeloyl-ACP methyl ester carboxylesterase